MALLNPSRLDVRLGTFSTGPAAAVLTDPALLTRVQTLRRALAGRVVAVDKAGIAKEIPAGEWHVSRKIDGEFTIIVWQDGELFTLNPGGTVRTGFPALEEAGELLQKAGIKQALIAAELFVQRADGKRPRVHDVVRVARKPETQAEVDSLRFAVFDLVEVDGAAAGETHAAARARMAEIFGKGQRIAPVESVVLKDAAAVKDQFEQWVEKEDGEGLMARSDAAGFFKIKPRHSLDAVIIGFTESTEDRAGMLHDALLALMRPDGSFQVAGRVGGGFTDEQRREILADLRDLACESHFTEVNGDRVPYQMVRPKLIAEVTIGDLISENTRGVSVDKMVLAWDAAAKCWSPVRRMPLANLIFPQFVRLRDDKTVHPSDLRLAQLSDLVHIPDTEIPASEFSLPKSEVMRRVVATKVLKGATMIRKLVLWKTNKESRSPNHPAWVLHLTDFSPNRKTPLEREIRVSNSRQQIDALWDALEAEYFVKGWNKV